MLRQTRIRTVILPTSISSACDAFFLICLQISIVIIEHALFKIDFIELIKPARSDANMRPRKPVKQNFKVIYSIFTGGY